ncbi:MAG: extracellular solute-binding protein [Clostridia bacterium]|nr:extracellular solute-binding protein [Clostridia bacterium]
MKKILSVALVLALALCCLSSIALAKTPTLKVLAVLDARSPKLETLSNFQRIEEETGVKIEWEYIPATAWDEQKSLILASGDLPDIFFGAKAMKTSDIMANVEYFLPLQDLIAEYGQNIQAMWEAVPNTKIANTYPDGNIYSIGHTMVSRPATEAAIYINKVWLDNLGLAMPTTVDELTEVLRAFRDQDANGNGDPNDEIPMIGRSLTSKYGPAAMRGYFQADNCIEYDLAVGEDGRITYLPVTENYKAWVQWVHTLISEGLLNSDVVTIDSTRYKALQANDEVALCGVLTGYTHSNAGKWMDEYEVLDIAEGPYGKAYVAANKANMLSGISGWATVSVTESCKEPEAAMKWINAFYDSLNGLQGYWGPLGEAIQDDGDGTYSFIMDEAKDAERGYKSYDNWYWGLGDGAPGYISAEVEAAMEVSPNDVIKLYADEIYADNIRDESYIYPPVILERKLNDKAAEIETDMEKMTKEMTAKWCVEGGVEAEWDNYVAEMNKMGLEEYLRIYQDKLDEIRK